MSETTDLKPDTLRVEYIKSAFFRVVHVDGIFGGPTPRGMIHMDVFSERQPIPQKAVYRITSSDDGEGRALGDEIREQRIGRDSIIREVEVGLSLDLEVAKSLRDWLNRNIEKLEKAIVESQNPNPKESQ